MANMCENILTVNATQFVELSDVTKIIDIIYKHLDEFVINIFRVENETITLEYDTKWAPLEELHKELWQYLDKNGGSINVRAYEPGMNIMYEFNDGVTTYYEDINVPADFISLFGEDLIIECFTRAFADLSVEDGLKRIEENSNFNWEDVYNCLFEHDFDMPEEVKEAIKQKYEATQTPTPSEPEPDENGNTVFEMRIARQFLASGLQTVTVEAQSQDEAKQIILDSINNGTNSENISEGAIEEIEFDDWKDDEIVTKDDIHN